MNKLIATIALAALAFTSCIKENNIWDVGNVPAPVSKRTVETLPYGIL